MKISIGIYQQQAALSEKKYHQRKDMDALTSTDSIGNNSHEMDTYHQAIELIKIFDISS